MAIGASMSQEDNNKLDEHENDLVMPGFRFHPTEEELIQFYLRRKVEGKRFNVELITFLDLYRYDPWELPGLAAAGEKEWYFYVPRDRKYRNGDRPNRVTTSGYWKATGADRMIRAENFQAIGLKKTLVFYTGKAPKGIRTSWIMNEYRLPQHETQRLQKAEISLCRVYKRAGVEDHPSVPLSACGRASSSSSSSVKKHPNMTNRAIMERSNQAPEIIDDKLSEASGSSITDVGTISSIGLSGLRSSHIALAPMSTTPLSIHSQEEQTSLLHTTTQLLIHTDPSIQETQANKRDWCSLAPESNGGTMFSVFDLQRLVNFQQHHTSSSLNLHHQLEYQNMPYGTTNVLPASLQAPFSDRLWDRSSTTLEASDQCYPFPFK